MPNHYYNPYTFKLHTSLHRSVPSILTFAINWALRKQLIYLSSQSHRHLLLARLTDWHLLLARLTDFHHLLVKELCPFVKGILDQKCAPFCSVLKKKKKEVCINQYERVFFRIHPILHTKYHTDTNTIHSLHPHPVL